MPALSRWKAIPHGGRVILMAMKPPAFTEGREAFTNFTGAMQKLLSVPKAELLRREAEYKAKSEAAPTKRGPKKKAKD